MLIYEQGDGILSSLKKQQRYAQGYKRGILLHN